jgi:Arc/MetJ-type ribon-helix-helix transcriptional regulator
LKETRTSPCQISRPYQVPVRPRRRCGYYSVTIHLSKEQERFVHDAVRAGLYASEDAVVNDALDRLRQTMPRNAKTPVRMAKTTKAAPQKPKKPMTEAEFDQHLLAIGLLSQLPDSDADFDDPDDEPITIKGEPLSETVIRERR